MYELNNEYENMINLNEYINNLKEEEYFVPEFEHIVEADPAYDNSQQNNAGFAMLAAHELVMYTEATSDDKCACRVYNKYNQMIVFEIDYDKAHVVNTVLNQVEKLIIEQRVGLYTDLV